MRLIVAAAAFCLALPVHAGEPASEPAEKQEEEAKEPKKICRYVSDMGSRRKTRVCLTAEQWRKANQGE